jgi:type I restriction enzyme S subunit
MIEGPYKLPEGWRWVRLGEVCEIIMGQSPPSKSYNPAGRGLPFFQGKADFGEIYPTPRVWCDAPKKIARMNDILISVRAPVGAVNIAKDTCCIGRGLAALRLKAECELFWLFWYLKFIEKYLAEKGSGSTFKAITKKDIENLFIPLPPLDEQKRIVARIEELMDRIKEAKKLRQETKKQTELLWQSVLVETFPQPGTQLPEGWRWVRLGEVFKLKNGKFIRTTDLQAEGNIPVYGSNGLLGFTTNPLLTKGRTIVIGRVGACGAINVVDAPCWISDNAMFVANWFIECDIEYVAFALRNIDFSFFIKKGAQPSISQELIYNIFIPLPPLEEQKRIANFLQEVHEKIQELKEVQAKTEEEIKLLEQSILEKAFRGEL